MPKRLTEPFGKAGLTVAVCALVMALVGGAYAAGGLTKSQEKQVTKIAKRYAGKPGAPGAPGTNGTNGKDGAEGKQGAEGKEGLEGKPGKDGEDGSPWTAGGTLPSGKTETGAWSIDRAKEGVGSAITSISFPIPLASPLGASKVHLFAPDGEELFQEGIELKQRPPVGGCTGGTAESPKADAGNFCVYITKTNPEGISEGTNPGEIKFASEFIVSPGASCEEFGCVIQGKTGTGTSGAMLLSFDNEAFKAWGTWAVTAP